MDDDPLYITKAEISQELGIEIEDENAIKMEIAPGIFKKYQNKTSLSGLNESFQIANIWLWKWSLSKGFIPKVKIESLCKLMNSMLDYNIDNRIIGRVVNHHQISRVTKQSGAYGRPFTWNWECADDLSNSMWLFAKMWLFDEDLIRLNAGNNIAPGKGTKEEIEFDLKELGWKYALEAYIYSRRNVAKETEQWSHL